MANRYEVELKFRLEQSEPVAAMLGQWGAVERGVVSQIDRYFNHPARDFRVTDEAFRLRSVGDANCVTYKGALLGTVAKTRHEIEVGFADGAAAAESLFEMVRLLGFRFVRDVRKTRRSFALHWKGHEFDVALDDVSEIGRFLEIERIAEDDHREAAEAAVWELARSLGLSFAEPRSYLELLLESDGLPR